MSNLIKNSAIYAIGDIAPRLLSFISFPILTTYLTPAEYGIVNYVNTVNLFLTIIGFLCLNTYYLVFYYRMENETERQKLLGNLFIFVVGFNIVISLLMFTAGQHIFGYIGSNIDFYPYMAIGLITNLFNIFAVLPSALFRLQERPLPLTILNVLKGILIFGLTLWFVVKLGFKAEGVLYANMVVTVFFGVLFAGITMRNMVWNINLSQIKCALVFSLPLLPGSLSYYLVSMSDRLLIDKYLTLEDLGIYSTASTLALVLNIVAYGAYKAFEPYFFKIYGSHNFLAKFKKVHDGYFFVLVSGAMGLAIFAKEFFQVFSEARFHIAYYYVPIILIGVITSSMNMLYSTIITAREKTKVNSVIAICGGLISVSLNMILLPLLGIAGACVTSAVALFAMLLASICFSKVVISYDKIVKSLILVISGILISVYFYPISSLVASISIKCIIYIFLVLAVAFIMQLPMNLIWMRLFALVRLNNTKYESDR